MILDETVKTKITASNRMWWKSKGYDLRDIKWAQPIEVKVRDLQKKSNVRVNCKCDKCGILYTVQYCGGINKCARCTSSIRMIGNGNSRRIPLPPKEELRTLIDYDSGKVEIGKLYNVSITTVTNWLKYYELTIIPHRGTIIDMPKDFEEFCVKNPPPTIVFMMKKYDVSKPTIIKWMRKIGAYV